MNVSKYLPFLDGFESIFATYMSFDTPMRGVNHLRSNYPQSCIWITFYLFWIFTMGYFPDFKDFSTFYGFLLEYQNQLIFIFEENPLKPEFLPKICYYIKLLPRIAFSVLDDRLQSCQSPEDPCISNEFRNKYLKEISAYFRVKSLPEYGEEYEEKDYSILEALYNNAYKNALLLNPSFKRVKLSNFITLPVEADLVDLDSFSDRDVLNRYFKIGDYIRRTPEYRTFIQLCKILNTDFHEDPLFIFIVMSSGMGKSQLPFSIEDFPLLYFCKKLATSKQGIYKPFENLSDLLNKYLKRDLKDYIEVVKKDKNVFNHGDFDCSVIKKLPQKSWLLGFVVALLRRMNQEGPMKAEKKWIRRQLMIENIAVFPLSPAEVRSILGEMFEDISETPIFFCDECHNIDIELKLLRSLLMAAGIMPIFMGTNAQAEDLVGNISLGMTRRHTDPWCIIITKLSPFCEDLIDIALKEKYSSDGKITELLHLLKDQRPWFSNLILEELSKPERVTSISKLLHRFYFDFAFNKISNPRSKKDIRNQFFFHACSLLESIQTAVKFNDDLINNHLAHLYNPESSCELTTSNDLKNLFKQNIMKQMAIPLYVCDRSYDDQSVAEMKKKHEAESRLTDSDVQTNKRDQGRLFYINQRDRYAEYGILSAFDNFNLAKDCLTYFSLLEDPDFLSDEHRSTSLNTLLDSRGPRHFKPRHNNGTYLEVLTCVSAAISSRTKNFELISFKEWICNFIADLSFSETYSPQKSITFAVDAAFLHTLDAILNSFLIPYTYFPDATPCRELASLFSPGTLGEIHISQNLKSYDAKMDMYHNRNGTLELTHLYFECKSIEKGVGIDKIGPKLNFFAGITPLPPLVIFVVNDLSVNSTSFSDYSHSYFYLSLIANSHDYAFNKLKIGNLDQIVLFVDMSVLNSKHLEKLEMALKN